MAQIGYVEAQASTHIWGRLVVEESRSGTTSTVTATLQVRRTNSYSGATTPNRYADSRFVINIDGTEYSLWQTTSSYVKIPAYNNEWITVGSATKSISHTAAMGINCSWYSVNIGTYLSCSDSVGCTLAAFITKISASMSNVVSYSSNVSAKIAWTGQSGATVNIACEIIDNSGNFISTVKQWTGASSGSTFSLIAAERASIDTITRNNGYTRIRWTLKTCINGTVTYYDTHDYEYWRASIPSVNTWPTNTPDFNVGNSITIHCNRQRSGMTHKVVVQIGSFSKTISTNAGDNASWGTANDAPNIYAQNTTGNSRSGTVTLTTYNGSAVVGTNTCSINANFNTADIRPTFSDFSYRDSNSVTTAITGNNQYFIKGKSTVEASISTGQKMVARYSASASSYSFQLGSTTVSKNYSSTSAVTASLGTPVEAGAVRLTVRAFDSRSNATAASKDISVLDYAKPTVTGTLSRLNNFENQTTLKISGVFTRLIIGGVDKNTIEYIKYRYRPARESSWDGHNWNEVEFSINGSNVTVADILLNLDNTSAFDFEIQIKDRLEIVTATAQVQVGIPLINLLADGRVAFGCIPENTKKGIHVANGDHIFQQIYPVGAIFESTSSADPATTFGGNWSQLGTRTVGYTTIYTFRRTS